MILRTNSLLHDLGQTGPSNRRAVVGLGGGGARGLAHFGALQAVLESGLAVHRIVGTSIGSLAGAMIALDGQVMSATLAVREYVTSPEFRTKQNSLCGANPRLEDSEASGMLAWYDRIKSFLWARRLLTRVFRRRSLLSSGFLTEVVNHLVPDIDISDTRIPLSIVTVDLRSGHQVVLEKGPLRKAILASASIPGVFPPVEWDQMLLCDFGVLDSLPSQVARAYQEDLVIGVDVGPNTTTAEHCQSALHVLLRMDEIAEKLLRRQALAYTDVLIRPDVGHFQWFDFSRPDQLFQAGLLAGRSALSNSACVV